MASVLLFTHRMIQAEDFFQTVKKRAVESGNCKQQISEGKETLIVSFLPWESDMINQMSLLSFSSDEIAVIMSDETLDQQVLRLFFQWSWTSELLRCVFLELHPEEVNGHYQGDYTKAFEFFLTMIRVAKITPLIDRRCNRATQLLRDNPDLLHYLKQRSIYGIDPVYPTRDTGTWRLLCAMLIRHETHVVNILDVSSVFEGDSECSLLEEPVESVASGMNLDVGVNQDSSQSNYEGESTPADGESQAQGSSWDFTSDVDEILELQKVWDVWRICRMLWLLERRPRNEIQLRCLLDSQHFQQHWREVRINCGALEQTNQSDEEDVTILQGFLAQKPFSSDTLDSVWNFFSKEALQELTNEYRRQTHYTSLQDPAQYLHFLPWNELVECREVNVLNSLCKDLDLDLCQSKNGHHAIFLWHPPDFKWLHEFYITEDFCSYTSKQHHDLPGLEPSTAIYYHCCPLQESNLVENLRDFWPDYNDCVVTCNPEDGQLYVLQTIVGAKAREILQSEQSRKRSSLETFFESVLRHHPLDEFSSENNLKRLLGSNYKPRFKYTIRFIDVNEFSQIHPESIGQGSFGKVYHATWKYRPNHKLGLGHTSAGDVAIKVSSQLTKDGLYDEKKFIHELELIQSIASENSSGFLSFFGITKISIDVSGRICAPSTDACVQVFGLVFLFADQGSFFDHLERQFVLGEWRHNWAILLDGLASFNHGLERIHQKGLLHRDIHPGNLLVESETFPYEDKPSYNCLLSDLGEGKTIQQTIERSEIQYISTSGSFGLACYRAPEIRDKGYSSASDVFGGGRIILEIIRRYHQHLVDDAHKDEGIMIPEKFHTLLEGMLEPEPGDRLDALVIGLMLQEIRDSMVDVARWVSAEGLIMGPRWAPQSSPIASFLRT